MRRILAVVSLGVAVLVAVAIAACASGVHAEEKVSQRVKSFEQWGNLGSTVIIYDGPVCDSMKSRLVVEGSSFPSGFKVSVPEEDCMLPEEIYTLTVEVTNNLSTVQGRIPVIEVINGGISSRTDGMHQEPNAEDVEILMRELISDAETRNGYARAGVVVDTAFRANKEPVTFLNGETKTFGVVLTVGSEMYADRCVIKLHWR